MWHSGPTLARSSRQGVDGGHVGFDYPETHHFSDGSGPREEGFGGKKVTQTGLRSRLIGSPPPGEGVACVDHKARPWKVLVQCRGRREGNS